MPSMLLSGEPSTSVVRPTNIHYFFAFSCFLASAPLYCLFAYMRGQDINYDLMNYHHFSAFELLKKEPFYDIAVEQQFLNPLIDVPHWLLNSVATPKVATALIVLLQSTNVPLVYLLTAFLVQRHEPSSQRLQIGLSLCAAAVAGLAPTFVTEIGTSFVDCLTSILIIAGLCFLVLSVAPQGKTTPALPIAAGLCLGAAVGLKLTNVTFAVATFLSLLFVGELRTRVARTGAFLFGSIVGTVLTAGYWTFVLYAKFRNPVFPFFNSVFKSPFRTVYTAASLLDERRFLPRSLFDAMSYPFQWVVGLHPSSELSFRDLRFAVLFIAVSLLGLSAAFVVVSQASSPFGSPRTAAKHPAMLLVSFSVISFGLWIKLFAYQRYLLPLELVAGTCLIAVGILFGLRNRVMMIPIAVAAVAICAWGRPSDFGHSAWAARVARTELPKEILESNGLFLLYGWPTTYLIPDFARRARFFDIHMLEDPNNAMGQTFSHILATEERPMYSIQGSLLSAESLKFLSNFGLRQDGIDCVYFASFIGARRVDLALCPVFRSDTGAMTAAATYPLGRTIVFGRPGRNSIFYETSGWGIENDTGRAWDPSAKELHLRLEIMQKPPEKLALKFSLVVPPGQCNFDVTINGTSVFEARNAENCNDGKFDIVLPTGVVGLDRLLDIAFVRFALPSSANEPIVIRNLNIRPL